MATSKQTGPPAKGARDASESAKNGPELHFSFVEMLFALAIAEVAIMMLMLDI